MTNEAAIGYAIIAARWLELDHKTIQKLERAMIEAMDEVTEDAAEGEYRNL